LLKTNQQLLTKQINGCSNKSIVAQNKLIVAQNKSIVAQNKLKIINKICALIQNHLILLGDIDFVGK